MSATVPPSADTAAVIWVTAAGRVELFEPPGADDAGDLRARRWTAGVVPLFRSVVCEMPQRVQKVEQGHFLSGLSFLVSRTLSPLPPES